MRGMVKEVKMKTLQDFRTGSVMVKGLRDVAREWIKHIKTSGNYGEMEQGITTDWINHFFNLKEGDE